MTRRSLASAAGALCAAAMLLTLAPMANADPAPVAPATPKPAPVREMTVGSPQAPVTVTEYLSITCPHCARWERDVWPAFKAKYVDTGKVRFVLREEPTDPVDLAVAGFLVARCAGPDKDVATIQRLLADQQALFNDPRATLTAAGAAVGLDAAKVQACATDAAAGQALLDRAEANGKADGVQGTPTFVIGGKPYVSEQSLSQLDAALAPLLAGRRSKH